MDKFRENSKLARSSEKEEEEEEEEEFSLYIRNVVFLVNRRYPQRIVSSIYPHVTVWY